MSEYLDWEDLIDDEDQEPSSQEDRPALDDLLNREDIPDELKELLKTRQELEDQLKSFSLGQNNEPEQDARDKQRFPVKTHTVESRLEEKRQKKIDERKRTAEIRYRERLAGQRKDAEKRFESIELQKREELARKKVLEAQAQASERRRTIWRREAEADRQQQENWLAERRLQQQANILADKRQRELDEQAALKRRELSVEKRLHQTREENYWEQRTHERLAAATQSIVEKKLAQRRADMLQEAVEITHKKRLEKKLAEARKEENADLERQFELRNELVGTKQEQKRQEQSELDARDQQRIERANERLVKKMNGILAEQSQARLFKKMEEKLEEKSRKKLEAKIQERIQERTAAKIQQKIEEKAHQKLQEKIAEKKLERRAEERRLNRDTGTSDRYE